jgi:hypothetical protein
LAVDGQGPEIDVVTPSAMMMMGLVLVNYRENRIRRAKPSVNVRRFVSHYSALPMVLAILYSDLQTTSITNARITGKNVSVRYFLIAMHTLKQYPTEDECQAISDISHKHGHDAVWYYLEKIQSLKAAKIVWPSDEECEGNTWILSVDGTHCWLEEPQHPEFFKTHRTIVTSSTKPV